MSSLDNKNLISLKEAAELSGYSADYIGQLIRSGKIPGKQVYTNIAWMTTAEAISEYKNKSKITKKDNISDKVTLRKRKIAMELDILKLFFNTFKLALPLISFILVSLVILFTIIFYNILAPEKSIVPIVDQDNEILEF